MPVGNPHLQGVVAVDFVGSRLPGLAALAENGDVMRRQRHDDLIGVSKADAIEDAEPAVPFSHEKDGNIADQELPIRLKLRILRSKARKPTRTRSNRSSRLTRKIAPLDTSSSTGL